jgi:hypothetical protein
MLTPSRCVRWLAAQALALLFVLAAVLPASAQTAEKLLLSQVEVLGSEYFVIKNTGSGTVDLSDYYVTDATFPGGNQYYYNLPDPALPIGGGGFNDFVARFPAGATIAPGESLSVSVSGSDDFRSAYGQDPNFELFEDGAAPDNVPDMRDARPGSINQSTPPTLSNNGEILILFYWNGNTNLVTDIDYVVWGDKAEAVDKTGITISVSGLTGPTSYQPDTPIANQAVTLVATPTDAFLRVDDSEGTQISTGSNGVNGRDETSENLNVTFVQGAPDPPGMAPVDVTPPTLVSASGSAGTNSVEVVFSEALGAGAGTSANYLVFPQGNEAGAFTTDAASLDVDTVTLTLGGTLQPLTTYVVRVNNVEDEAGNAIAADSEIDFTTGAGGVFGVTGVFQFGADYVGVAFSKAVGTATATDIANYGFSPPLTIDGITIQENGQTAVLHTASPLPTSTAYSVTVSGVQSGTGESLAGTGPFSMTTAAATVLNIRTVQENYATYTGTTISVVGEVYIPAGSRGGTPSAFIQDGSGRGINLFGGNLLPDVNAIGNVVVVTGTADAYFTTREITNYTTSLLASDQPALGAVILSTGAANSSSWEGTYIQSTGVLQSKDTSSSTSAVNYFVNDGSGEVTLRVDVDLGFNPADYQVGETLTGRGAGAAFQTTFQVTVGNVDDFYKGGGGPDLTPPTILSASGTEETNTVTVVFSEPVAAGAETPANYLVFPQGNPGAAFTTTAASADVETVTLTLGGTLQPATTYTVRVNNVEDEAGNVIAADSEKNFTTGAGSVFAVTGVFPFGKDYVGVGFSQKLNPATATTVGNYSFSPPLSIGSISIQENGRTAVLHTSSSLPSGTTYSVTITGVQSATGSSLTGNGPFSMSTSSGTITNIAEVQNNWNTYLGGTVTIIGEVYIPAGSRGGTPSAFIQDGSGRGINLFGGTLQADVNAIGNVVEVTGTADEYFTTREVINYTTSLIDSQQPALGPVVLTTGAANSPAWEGTYIEATGELKSKDTASSTSAVNYFVDDGSGELTLRVDVDLGFNPNDFAVGATLTGRGAGAAFQTTYQVTVGNQSDFFEVGAGEDTTPPTLVSASGVGGSNTLLVLFSEAVGTGANVPGNYTVYPTGIPGSPLAVTAAVVSGSQVTLSLGTALDAEVSYTVLVSNVEDQSGNVIVPASSIAFTAQTPGGGGEAVKLLFTQVNVFDEYVVIKNPSSQVVDLSDVYYTDATFSGGNEYYYNIVNPSLPTGGGTFTDFFARFPNGAKIGPGAEITVASSAASFEGNFGFLPSYELYDTNSGVPDMREARPGLIGSPPDNVPGLSNAGEMVVLFFWDGQTDLVTDLDYVVWGDKAEGVDKTGVTITGPGGGAGSTYLPDTPIAQQDALAPGGAPTGGFVRVDEAEGNQVRTGGNGVDGRNEMSENLSVTFTEDPNATPPETGPSGFSVVSASGSPGSSSIALVFNADVGTGGNVAGNYKVYNSENEADSTRVRSAAVSQRKVTLELAKALEGGTRYTVEVNNVSSTTGDLIPAGTTIEFLSVSRLYVPAATVLKGLEEIPITVNIPTSNGMSALLRIFDMQGRLMITLADLKFTDSGGYEATITWDARDSEYEFVRAGTYVCHLQTKDLNGKVIINQAPIVVAVRLN